MSPSTQALVLSVGLALAIIITHFIARKIARSLTPRAGPWVYLAIAFFPGSELVGLWRADRVAPANPYFWFWFIFMGYCLFAFWRTKPK